MKGPPRKMGANAAAIGQLEEAVKTLAANGMRPSLIRAVFDAVMAETPELEGQR